MSSLDRGDTSKSDVESIEAVERVWYLVGGCRVTTKGPRPCGEQFFNVDIFYIYYSIIFCATCCPLEELETASTSLLRDAQ